MAGTFSDDAINRSVLLYFDENFVESANTVVEDLPDFDTESIAEWVEFGLRGFNRPKRRKQNKIIVNLEAFAHIYVKTASSDLYRPQKIADAIVLAFDQKTIGVTDYEAAGEPQVGWVSFREAHIQDLSRDNESATPAAGQHFLVTIPARAQES